MYGVIYKITNPNSRIYIGQTKNFKKRLGHYKEMENLEKLKQPIIGNSIKKYSFDNHIIEIIEECDCFEKLNERESFWIEYYKSNCYKYPELRGMNCSDGGDVIQLEDITKQKLSEQSKSNIEIHQYDLEGFYISSWRSTNFAVKELKVPRGSLQKCLKGLSHTSGGFQWSYTKKLKIDSVKYKNSNISNKVNQILNNEIIKVWESYKELEKFGFTSSSIKKACENKTQYKEFYWQLANIEPNKNTGLKKSVICTFENGEILEFTCKKEVVDFLKLKEGTVKNILLGYTKQKKEFTLKYK